MHTEFALRRVRGMGTDETAGTPGAAANNEPRRISSRDLFDGAREIAIEHDGELYRLRRTSKGKLILTK